MEASVNKAQRGVTRYVSILSVLLILGMLVSPALPAQAAGAPAASWVAEANSAQQGGPRFEPGACNFDIPSSLLQGENLQCGNLVVPEMYENPGGPTIQLGVAIIKSRSANPAPDPLVMLQGGPGGSTIDTYLQILPTDPRFRDIGRDIILFDQRGTKYAKPSLFCQQYYEEGIRQLNEDISRADADKRAQAALKACHDQWASEGINLSAFNSLENAADVDALRQALGYQKINLYGVSYGTLLALHVMRQFPQGLRTVILDSVVPPQTNFILDATQSQNRAMEAVFGACAQQPDCNAAYPNLKKVFYDEVDRLNANKAHIQVSDSKTGKVYPALLDGDTLINAVGQMLYITDLIPLIPRTIYNARAGDYALVEQVLGLVVFDRSLNLGMYFSVLCAEDADINPQQTNLTGLPKELEPLAKENVDQFLQTCSFWNVKALPATVDQPVSSSIPTLVLSGAFDPITPPAYAQEAAKTLSGSYFFLIPEGGHGEVTSGECQDKIFLEFLDNPNQKPDSACLTSQKVNFSTPGALVRIPGLIKLLSLQGTSGIELGLYALALLFLLTALLVYPIAWLVRLFRGPKRQPVPVTPYAPMEGVYPAPEPAPAPRARPTLYRLGPWLAGFAGLLLLAFIIATAVIAFRLALTNDYTVLLGLPGSTRPLFLLPWIAGLLALLMMAGAVLAWARRAGSVWGRLYYSLLTLAAWVCVAILGVWGMLSALFAG